MNYTTFIENYLWGISLPEIDNKTLFKECKEIENFVHENFSNKVDKFPSENYTTNKFSYYNVFWFPLPEIQNLFSRIRNAILPALPREKHVMQCWVNFYYQEKYIDWHTHWTSNYRAVHGFYCVNTENEPSYTEYKVEHLINSTVKIESKDGLLVFGKSDKDLHRSSKWKNKNPRVTIAFDIIPISTLNEFISSNQRVPTTNFVPFF